MCLIVFDWNQDTKELVLASNRDEYYDRPSQAAHYWNKDDDEDVNDDNTVVMMYGGRDSLLGGTWLACSLPVGNGKAAGRLAAVTNYHDLRPVQQERPTKYPLSRGDLVRNFLTSTKLSAAEYCQQLEQTHDQYGGFGALFMDGTKLYFCTNRKGKTTNPKDENPTATTSKQEGTYSLEYRELDTGVYGLSNHLMDTPWPKLNRAKEGLKQAIVSSHTHLGDQKESSSSSNNNDATLYQQQLATELVKVMENDALVDDRTLLPTTLGLEEEHVRSAIFVRGPTFGTRTTTIVTYSSSDQNPSFHVTEKNHRTPSEERVSISYQHVKSIT